MKARFAATFLLAGTLAVSCAKPADTPTAKNLVLVTIDTVRPDHLNAYGYRRPQPQSTFFDWIASTGVLFEHAYAAAPITLPSHATLLSGRYPPGHGSRDNGMRVSDNVPTLATELKAQGFKTAAFVAAFPLDHQFGLARGFDVYSDRLPRDAAGRQANERPASQVVDEAIAWLKSLASPESGAPSPEPRVLSPQSPAPSPRFFLWVHLFEPHAPYGNPDDRRPVMQRYDEEIAAADRELLRLLEVIGMGASPDTIVIAASDHGEAFGEHGEYAHSIFVYETTLHVPLAIRAPGIRRRQPGEAHAAFAAPVTLADVAPTAMRMLGFTMKDVDGIDLTPALTGGAAPPARELYAESFAPLIEFGWAPLRSVRSGAWKYIAAPKPELYDLQHDAAEQTNAIGANADTARRLEGRVARYSPDTLDAATAGPGPAAAERLRALGYSSGSASSGSSNSRPDPKDRRELAARIAQVTAGELSGAALVDALEGIVREDPRNGQAHLRLGYARVQAGDCVRAEREFQAALASGLTSVDVYLGLAGCQGQRRDLAGAAQALQEAQRLEPDNPVVAANIGILKASQGDTPGAVDALKRALAGDPNLHEARFNLALTYARAGQRPEAEAAARELLARLPADSPQRPEVERLLRAITGR